MDYKDTYIMYNSKMIYDYYFIIDTDKLISRKIFRDNGINVTFLNTMRSKDTHYVVYECRTLKRNREIFDKCIEKLCNNMLIIGNRDYIEFSDGVISKLSGKYNDSIVECTGMLNNSYIASVDADEVNHKEFIMIPGREDSEITFQYVADRIKNLIDVNKLGYRRLTISVRNLYSKEEKIFNYMNE